MKASSFLLILLMVISAGLAACSQSGEKKEDAAAESTSAVKEAEEKVEEAESDVVKKTEELHQEQLSELEKKSPEEVAKELWNLINTEEYKVNWKQHKPEGATAETPVTYLNPTAEEALRNRVTPLPPGSIIVEEDYNESQEIETINAVINLGGEKPEGGWFYAQYSPDGKILKSEEKGASINAPE
ncbi:MAG: hypothetical protein IT344_06360 [Candidatus Dadabacteria bacterium]|nr:hypothetical protein [Candidatus Dadabacteria bacterium]